MRHIVTFYISDHDVANDELDRIGWWWAYADKNGEQTPSVGPFETKEDAIYDANDDRAALLWKERSAE